MNTVVFIRPGKTESGREGRMLGQADESLLPEERERLSKRAEQGVYPAVSRLYACPSARCRETALLAYPGLFAVMINELVAFDCGEFEGMTMEELNHSEMFLQWASAANLANCPGGDNLNWYAARCMKTFRAIMDEMASYHIDAAAIVAHGLAVDLIVQRICLPRTRYQDLTLAWGGALVLDFHPAQFAATVTEIR